MYNLIILLPLFGAISSWILGNKWSSIPTYVISIGCLLTAMIISWIAFYDIIILKNDFLGLELPWLSSGNLNSSWGFN